MWSVCQRAEGPGRSSGITRREDASQAARENADWKMWSATYSSSTCEAGGDVPRTAPSGRKWWSRPRSSKDCSATE